MVLPTSDAAMSSQSTPLVLSVGSSLLGSQPMQGLVVSATVTLNLQESTLPTASVAYHVTVVVPMLNCTPSRVLSPLLVVAPVSFHVMSGSKPLLSVASASQSVPLWVWNDLSVSLLSFWSPVALQVMSGGVTSFTTTLNEHTASLPAASLAVHVTVVVPYSNTCPSSEVLSPAMSVVVPDNLYFK